MNTGMSLQQLSTEINRIASTKADYIADTRQLALMDDGRNLMVQDIGRFIMNGIAQQQVCNTLGIPIAYYDRMKQAAPVLLAKNVNHWFNSEPKTRMIRTVGEGTARAFLSSRYRALDNYDLANAVLPILGGYDLNIKSTALTEQRLYIKATLPKIQAEVRVGDVIELGILISNSEVGMGSLSISPFIHRLICKNGAVINELASRRKHIGKNSNIFEEGDAVTQMYSTETKIAEDRAFWLKVRDTIKGTLTQEVMDNVKRKFVKSTEVKIEGDVVKAVERVSKNIGLVKSEESDVLRHLIEGGDLSSYGLVNAVTRTANDIEDYDRSTELQVLGGKVLELGQQAWR